MFDPSGPNTAAGECGQVGGSGGHPLNAFTVDICASPRAFFRFHHFEPAEHLSEFFDVIVHGLWLKALDEVFALCSERGEGISRSLLLEYRAGMIDKALSPSTINVRLAAIRKLISEARKNNILDAERAAQMSDIPNVRQQGARMEGG